MSDYMDFLGDSYNEECSGQVKLATTKIRNRQRHNTLPMLPFQDT